MLIGNPLWVQGRRARNSRHLLRAADAPKRNASLNLLQPDLRGRVRGDRPARHRRIDHSRTDGIDPHVMAGILRREDTRELQQRALGRAIRA